MARMSNAAMEACAQVSDAQMEALSQISDAEREALMVAHFVHIVTCFPASHGCPAITRLLLVSDAEIILMLVRGYTPDDLNSPSFVEDPDDATLDRLGRYMSFLELDEALLALLQTFDEYLTRDIGERSRSWQWRSDVADWRHQQHPTGLSIAMDM